MIKKNSASSIDQTNQKNNRNDWLTVGLAFIVSWPILSSIGYSSYVQRSGTPELGNFLAIFVFIFCLVLAAFLTLVLFSFLKSSLQRILLPSILGGIYLVYFAVFGNRHLSDLSSSDWENSIVYFLPLMIGYISVSFRNFLINNKLGLFLMSSCILMSSLFGLLIASALTFQNRETDKLFYFYKPEMLKLDVTTILPEKSKEYTNYARTVYWDRGVYQRGEVRFLDKRNRETWGSFSAKNAKDRLTFQYDEFKLDGKPIEGDVENSYQIDNVKVDYKCIASKCEYIWGYDDFQFQFLISGYTNDHKDTTEFYSSTKPFAEILIKNSRYLENK